MELAQVTQVEDIKVGDVVVANYPGYAYTAVIDKIDAPDPDMNTWVFKCGTASKMVRHEDNKVSIQDKSNMEFMFNPELDEEPRSVFIVK